MEICREFLPTAALRPYVECLWFTPPVSETGYAIVPDGCVDACFVLSQRKPRAILFGTTTHTSAYELEAGVPYFGVRFRPGCASLFVKEKIAELTDTELPVSGLLGLNPEQLVDSAEMTSWQRRIESALLCVLSSGVDRRTLIVREAVAIIDAHHGNIRVGAIARRCSIGERQLERLFLERVGISPKLYTRIRRFRSVLSHLDDPPTEERPNFADVAASFGYTDQSHLVRDFQDFSHSLATQ